MTTIDPRDVFRTDRSRLRAAFALAIFLAAGWFVLDFSLRVRQRLDDVEDRRVALESQLFERKQTEALDAMVVGAISTSESAVRFYRQHLASLKESDGIPIGVLESGSTIVGEARLRIATAQGAVAALFANNPLAPEAVILRTQLQRINSSMGILESLFRDYTAQGPPAAIRRLKDADAWFAPDSLSALFVAMRANIEIGARAASSPVAAEYLAVSDSFLRQLWMSALAIAYSAVFMALVVRSRWRGMESRSNRTLPA